MANKYTVPIGHGNYVTPETAKMLAKLDYVNPTWFMGIFVLVFSTIFLTWWQTFLAINFCFSFGYWYYKNNYPDAKSFFT